MDFHGQIIWYFIFYIYIYVRRLHYNVSNFFLIVLAILRRLEQYKRILEIISFRKVCGESALVKYAWIELETMPTYNTYGEHFLRMFLRDDIIILTVDKTSYEYFYTYYHCMIKRKRVCVTIKYYYLAMKKRDELSFWTVADNRKHYSIYTGDV